VECHCENIQLTTRGATFIWFLDVHCSMTEMIQNHFKTLSHLGHLYMGIAVSSRSRTERLGDFLIFFLDKAALVVTTVAVMELC